MAEKAVGELPDKQSLCVDILVSGHVQAYVDFFYLTHRPDQGAVGGEDATEEQVSIPSEKLPLVKASLAEAEVARRRGDTKAVFGSYQQMAEFFGELSDQRTAVYFWEKCSEIARLTADSAGEFSAMRALGVAHEALRDVPTAVKYYEKLLHLARAASNPEGERMASTHLFAAYQSMATNAEAADDGLQALAFREKCLKSAEASGDRTMLSKAHYELGQAHERLLDAEHLNQAISHYKPYLTLCEEAADTEGQGSACFALAHVYQRLQDGVTSQTYLQRFLKLAQGSGKVSAQADACCALGVLYNQQGEYANAVEYLERFFELARSLGDRALLDKARTYLGIAKGNSILPAYTRIVTSDLDALLAWKNRRVPFADMPRASR